MSGPPTKEANQPATAVTDQRSGSAHLALVVLGLPLLLNLGVSAALILELRDFGVEQGHALDAVSRRKEAELALEVAAARRETIASEERNLSARVDQLRSQTTDLDARDAARSRAIEEESRATAKAAGLMQQAEQSQATYDALQSAIAASQERLATANAQRVSSQSTLQDLLPKKAALDAEVVELRKQIVDLDARNADRRHAVEEESRAAARTIELQKQVDLANAAIESLKAAVSTEQE